MTSEEERDYGMSSEVQKWGDARLPERFWNKTRVDPMTGCWIWIAATNKDGYGVFQLATGTSGGRQVRAHRYSYTVLIGPINHTIDHLCRNRSCVNPNDDHMEDVTSSENTRRGENYYRNQTHCKNGHRKRGTGLRCLPCHSEEQRRYLERKRANR